MSKKITQEIFLMRFFSNHINAEIDVIDYKAISLPATIKCLKCGKIYNKKAQLFITQHFCCDSEVVKLESIIKRMQNSDFSILQRDGKDFLIVQHIKCGHSFKRTISSVFANPFSCKFCNTHKISQQSSIEYAQQQLLLTHKDITILEYNGYEKDGKFLCDKCKQTFVQKYNCLLVSRGCPFCDRFNSLGETFIESLLIQKGLNFKKQYKIPELSSFMRFDFAVLDELNLIKYLIEVQGDFHYTEKFLYEPLEIIQERDRRKREYCLIHKIPLYELKYIKGKFQNLDILPE